MSKRYEIASFSDIEPTQCPCGFARRAFGDLPDQTASVHLVSIKKDSRVHYHERMTEIYVILEGEGHMELDGECIPVKPMDAVFIRPLCRHRAVGQMKVLNIPIPAFNSLDEHFDDPANI